MKPLYHPPLESMTVEGILYALSDPLRVQIFAEIAGSECAKNCSVFLKFNGYDVPKSSLSQHFKVLREAGLIRSERKGISLHNTTRCAEIKPRFGSMIESIILAYQAQERQKTTILSH